MVSHVTEGVGFREYFLDFFDWIGEFFRPTVKGIEDVDNPLNTTNAELEDVLDSAVETGKAGTDFLFAFHNLFESIAFAISPIALNAILVAVVAGIFGALLIYRFSRRSAHHLFLFLAVIMAIVVIMMILGTNPQF